MRPFLQLTRSGYVYLSLKGIRVINADVISSITISKGQKQRHGLARAFYQNAEPIVLDESTSVLNVSTEHQVMQEIRSTRGNTTTIILAHRLSTFNNVDQVTYRDSGNMVAIGTFLEARSHVQEFDKQIQLGVKK